MSDVFETFNDFAFRVESLPHYLNSDGSESAGYLAWLAGKPLPDDFNADWVAIVRSALIRGATVKRLRLISTPISSYEQYELRAGYASGIAAGEEIRVARRSDFGDLKDAWFLDDATVIRQVYGPDGTFVRGDESSMAKEDREMLDRCAALFSLSPSVSAYLGE